MEEKRESVILVPVPKAEFLVQSLRIKYDPSATQGIPAHITILFPFKNPEMIDREILADLKKAFKKVRRFSFILDKISTFPDVVFLEPSQKEKFIAITNEIVKVFPENPPYEGKFTQINPHLTIGHKLKEKFNEALIEAKQVTQNSLPVRAVAQEAWLMELRNGLWSIRKKFRFTY